MAFWVILGLRIWQQFLSEPAKKLSNINKTQIAHENASHFEANTERNDVQNLEKSPKIGKNHCKCARSSTSYMGPIFFVVSLTI